MSKQEALFFLCEVREDPVIHELVALRQNELLPEDLVEIGARLGFHFSPDELNQAFRHEWTMRWMSFQNVKSR
ncbi:MAG: Nif11-like leader peptide family natural product precursor [Candidatus Riflebacteria bacterium]|nr:Nif11-like leader peptide family natural product precursor [Candidatus Riflebacteria bacterium]